MPLPLLLGVASLGFAANKIQKSVSKKKQSEIDETFSKAKDIQDAAVKKYEECHLRSQTSLEKLGKIEQQIIFSLKDFSDYIEKIHDRPQFNGVVKGNVEIPQLDIDDIKQYSSSIDNYNAKQMAALAVMGMAAPALVLSPLGLMSFAVGNLVNQIKMKKLSDQANEAMAQAQKTEENAEKVCKFLNELTIYSDKYYESLVKVNTIYQIKFRRVKEIIDCCTVWDMYSYDDQLLIENTHLLVGLLFKMCKVNLAKKGASENDVGIVNTREINDSINEADSALDNIII